MTPRQVPGDASQVKDMLRLLEVVTTASNEAGTPHEAMQVAIDRICDHLGWPVGHATVVDAEGDVWVEPGVWHLASERFESFRDASANLTMALDTGLPSRVLASARPFWVADLSKVRDYVRRDAGDAVGLRSAMGLPVLVRDEVVAVLEFFGDEIVEPDDLVLEVMQHVGVQLGRVFERDRAQASAVLHNERIERNLRQAQKMEAVGRLAGGIAHDFNNILAVIGNYAGFLHEDLAKDDPRLPDVLEIEKAVDRAASLIRQLLAFSRKEVTSPEVLDLNGVIQDIQRILQRAVGEDVDLVFKPGTELWRSEVDRGQVEQVLMNLVVNGRDAMDAGGRLVIETCNVTVDEALSAVHEGLLPGPYVRIDVSDTGTGMDEEVRSQIFEPFFTTKERGEGTGLGLATVYGIVKQSGGYISVYSERGLGTTFRVFFPGSEKPAVGPEQVPLPVTRSGEGARVLVVEDDVSVRSVVSRILGRSGYEIVLAASGAEALELIQTEERPFDMLLTDVIMPGISGKELAARLRDHQPGVRTLFMSGYTDEIIAARGILEQDAELLQKPFTGPQLLERVQEMLVEPVA